MRPSDERAVPRAITGFHQDEHGDWVADLECGHSQHVRHDPPWQSRPWVTSEEGRRSHLGKVLECVRCAEGVPAQHRPRASAGSGPGGVWIGIVLLETGLSGHLLAAEAEGGRSLHYRHHILGFFILSVASAVLVAGVGRFFWRGRHDITLLIVGALQAVFGVLIFALFSAG